MSTSARHRASVTEIGDFIRHRSCQRRFRLAANKQALYRALPFADRPFHLIDPVLVEAGRRREVMWADSLRAAGLRDLGDRGEEEGARIPWEELRPRLEGLAPGTPAFAREVAVCGTIGAFELAGQIDFVVLTWAEGRPRLRLVECKASRRDRTYHRIQVALYRRMVRDLLADGPLVIGGVAIEAAAIEAVVVRLDEETGAGQSILETAAFEEIEAITHDLEELLARGGLLAQTIAAPVEGLPFQLDDKCDQCAYSAHCFAEGARQRRLELIGLAPSCARALRAAGVADLDALAELDRTGAQAARIAADPGLSEGLEVLQVRARARRATLPGGLEERPILARPYAGRGHLPAHEHEGRRLVRVYLSVSYDYVDNRVGGLAAHITRSDGELSTPFERLEDGRLRPRAGVDEEVVRYREWAGKGDEEAEPAPSDEATSPEKPWREVLERRPLAGVDLVRFQTVPWSGIYERDNGLELQLLQGFLRELVDAIADVADAEVAPLHFYVWNRAEIRRLMEAASRVGSGLLSHLRELFGCREGLEQLIYSCLQEEVHGRFALGWTGRGLSVATSLSWYGQRFHWRRAIGRRGREVDLGRLFYRDIFDFRERLSFHEQDPDQRWAAEDERGNPGVVDHRFEVRARSFDDLSAPYWRAYWGTLPSPATLRSHQAGLAEALRDYGEARQPGAIEAYLGARVHALRWLDERIRRKNTSIAKPALRLAELPSFELGTRHVGQAASDFLRLDHHSKAQDWLRAHFAPAIVRVAAGRSLPLCDLRLGDNKRVHARIDASLAPGGLQALQGHVSRGEGDFVRLHPRPAKLDEGPSYIDLVYRGRTAVIERLDWDRGAVELTVIEKYPKGGELDPYVLPSFPFRVGGDPRDEPFALATLDESLSDFIAGRVERRLADERRRPMKGRHVVAWFDPTEPRLPTMPPLDAAQRARMAAFLGDLRFGEGDAHRLEPSRVEAILAGIEARLQLIQGPPGTGKTTTTALALLTRILHGRRTGDLVLVAAHTHTAVDTLLERVRSLWPSFARHAHAAGLSMPKVGMRKVVSGSGDDDPPPGAVPTIPAKGSVRELKDLRKKGVLILGATVGTLLKLVDQGLNTAAEFKGLPEGFQAPLLVVDEASMLVFPHFLAVASLVSSLGQIMVAGDHRQLAPIVAHDWESEDRPPTVLYKPYVSAYEAIWRLREHPRVSADAHSIRIDQLAHTHRLPPVIRALLQPLYARDGIVLEGPVERPMAADWDGRDPWEAIWRGGHRLILAVHDEAASENRNPTEAAIIDAILGAAGELRPGSVAVVTPHRAQRALLRERLAARAEAVDLIDTVERLQGGERPTILFSATESDPLVIAQRVEFILDLNRSNVAFSRTQERLVVICARTLLDYIPPEVEDYGSALLWKHLREICDREVARARVDGVGVILRAPGEAWQGERALREVPPGRDEIAPEAEQALPSRPIRMHEPSLMKRREVIDALRRGTVPRRGLELFAVGIERYVLGLDLDLEAAASGRGAFKAIRGEYGTGKTFFSRWLEHRARERDFATALVQISETDTPLHRMETIYRRALESLQTREWSEGAFRSLIDRWFFDLEEEVMESGGDLDDPEAVTRAVGELLEKRLADVSATHPQFAAALRAIHRARLAGDHAIAEGLLSWLMGQPNVGADIKRAAGIKGDLDHFGASGFFRGLLAVLRQTGRKGLVLVLDEVETIQRVRADSREKSLNALRQLIDDLDAGHYPGMYVIITGTPLFFDGPQGVRRLPPLEQRLHVDFSGSPDFDNPRAPQIRLLPFDRGRLLEVGRRIRGLYPASSPETRARIDGLVTDDLLSTLADGITGKLGGKVGVAPRIFLRKLVLDLLDKIDLFESFDPRVHYKLVVEAADMNAEERGFAGIERSVDDINLDLDGGQGAD